MVCIIDNNPEACRIFNNIFDEKQCENIFGNHSNRLWVIWTKRSSCDMYNFIHIINIEDKIKLYKWIKSKIQLCSNCISSIDETNVKTLIDLDNIMNNSELVYTIFIEPKKILEIWIDCDKKIEKFLQLININDKLTLFFYYQYI